MIGMTRGSRFPRAWRPGAPPPNPESSPRLSLVATEKYGLRVADRYAGNLRSRGTRALGRQPGVRADADAHALRRSWRSLTETFARQRAGVAALDAQTIAVVAAGWRWRSRARRASSLPQTITGNVTSRAISERIARRRPPASVVRLLAGGRAQTRGLPAAAREVCADAYAAIRRFAVISEWAPELAGPLETVRELSCTS